MLNVPDCGGTLLSHRVLQVFYARIFKLAGVIFKTH